ncbi:MAG: hypothetical protein ABIS21_05000 [Acidimicrobiales bacterium]
MGSATDTEENDVLKARFGGTSPAQPATWYVALTTTTPTDAAAGTEVTGGAYARVALTNNTTNFPVPTVGVISNGTAVTFPAPTAAWGTVTHFELWDALTAGTRRYWGSLTTARTINNGDAAPSFAVGAIQIVAD